MPKFIAVSCIAAARTIMNKSPWDRKLDELLGITFQDVEMLYPILLNIGRELYRLRLEMEKNKPSAVSIH